MCEFARQVKAHRHTVARWLRKGQIREPLTPELVAHWETDHFLGKRRKFQRRRRELKKAGKYNRQLH
jgi:hypothetical protein